MDNKYKLPFYYSNFFLGASMFIAGVFIPQFRTSASWVSLCITLVVLVLFIKRGQEYKLIQTPYLNEMTMREKVMSSLNELQAEKEKKEKEFKEFCDALSKEKNDLEKQISALEEEIIVNYVDTADYSDITSEEIKNNLAMLKLQQSDLIKTNRATSLQISGMQKRRENALKKQILKAFTVDADLAISKMTYANVDATRGKIVRAFEMTNNMFTEDGIQLNKKLLNSKLEELNLVHQYRKKKEDEKEQQKAIKEQMIEEEKVRREIEREKAKIEKEERQFKNEHDRLLKYMSKAENDVERNIYIDKIKELEEKLSALAIDKKNVLEREANTRAGFVYIISNIGSFGENVYKIGMTRRLEPMDRVKELGSASVPFEFDVHAMIFSEDAPALETKLHKHFRENEVNKVNQRKEFFRVPISEIADFVKENYNATVEFTEFAKAEQYRESLKISASHIKA